MSWVNFDDAVQQLVDHGLIEPKSGWVSGIDCGRKTGQRCHVKGARQGGWFALHTIRLDDGQSALIGAYCWYTGAEANLEKIVLRVDGKVAKMSPEQRAAIAAQQKSTAAAAEAQQKAKNDKAARQAMHTWSLCRPDGDSAYLKRKGVAGYGVKYSPSGALVIPLNDTHGRIHGLQVIRPDKTGGRDKDFWPAGLAKKGHFFQIGTPSTLVLIAEGYATAATLHAATGLPAVVAFDAGNLLPVAQAIAKKYRRAKILICADDDFLTEGNPGVKAAANAALAVSGAYVVPEFAVDRGGKKLTDFNDLQAVEGIGAVRSQIEARLSALGLDVAAPDVPRAGFSPTGSGEEDDPRPAAVSIMELDALVERFLPIDDGTGKVVFDTWTNKLAHKDQMVALLAAGVRGDDIKRHPVWYQRGAYYLDEIGFDPAGKDKEVRLNTWQGWPLKPAAGSCELLLELVFQQCSKEAEIASALYKWLLQWMAYPLQNPGAKMGSAVVMHGPQGTGKSMIFTTLAEIYGYGRRRRNYAIVIDGQALHANFNLDWENKLFINAEEVVNAQDKWELKNQLKHLVTGQTIRVEGKHMNAVHNTNRVNISFLSNDLLPFPIEPDDRRHCVIYTPPPLPKEFFKRLVEEIANGGRAAFYHHLLTEVDCSDFDHTRPPMTTAKKQLQRLSSSSELRFLTDWALGDLGLPVCPALADDVYSAYVRWCRNNGESRPRPSNVFHATIAHLGCGWEKKKCRIYTSRSATTTEPKPLVLPPPDAMQREGTAMREGTPVARWLTDSVSSFRQAVFGANEERNEWAA